MISVIIPVKNRIQLFIPALDSVLNQRYPSIEVIVVDDGCNEKESEHLEQVISKARGRHSNIPIMMLKGNQQGAAKARNLGYLNAKGKYIQFFDSDDILLENKLSIQAGILDRQPELDMVYTKAQFVDDELNTINGSWGSALKGNSMDYFAFTWQTMCPLYRRETIDKFGLWDEELSINQDWEFCLRYKLLGARTHFINEVHAYFRKHTLGNIGNIGLDNGKVKSKWLSTYKIFQLCKTKGVLDKPLLDAFIKRWAYIVCMTSKVGDKSLVKTQLQSIRPEISSSNFLMFSLLRYRLVANLVLSVYSRYGVNK
ncbi:hypothetical protein OI18_11300 [Flavihumibacter solisilvae]|uniref:Glycosyltransferase 2-like domain-containing protein n=1 Tax=Flavihumibacter solisilvae TaxID=1349421 RepID=A0A0C1L528_9BACT|nr:glycosyltransferase family A protein [Flavihumibacter solisilvae]KIC94661.1 hypothetical protein OI18_11300 [Flavihumibacter solisilvae]